ncbi:MAG: histone deacetylase [Vicinamibacterales bacterium]
MRIVYSPSYRIDLGSHVFPTAKYGLLADRLTTSGLARPGDFVEPIAATWEQLGLVHTPEYLERLRTGDFRVEQLAQLEVAWSPAVVEGFRLMAGGTVTAGRLAVARSHGPVVAHLGGGTHHAFPDHGEGFCFFNDVAVAIRVLLAEGLATSAAVVDLDVHQGNGTAFIFAGDPAVFTFSMHQQYNYPVQKPQGSLDIGLPDGTGDDEYNARLDGALKQVFEHMPDVVFYLAGADPFEDDQLGGLALSKAGLRQRDRQVLQAARNHGVPAVVCLAGGYARRLDDTVEIHYATVEEASRL